MITSTLIFCGVPWLLGMLCWLIWVCRRLSNQKRKAVIERAEQQHRQWMNSDSRGFYGDYPPADL